MKNNPNGHLFNNTPLGNKPKPRMEHKPEAFSKKPDRFWFETEPGKFASMDRARAIKEGRCK